MRPIHRDIWKANYAGALEHVELTGNLPYQRDPDPELQRLGKWVKRQLERLKGTIGNKHRPLDTWQVDLMNQLLDRSIPRTRPWLESFAEVRWYAETYGLLPSAESPDPDVRRMGNWVTMERYVQYGANHNGLTRTTEQRELFRSITSPRPTFAERWDMRFAELTALCEEAGGLPSRKRVAPTQHTLLDWYNRQRMRLVLRPAATPTLESSRRQALLVQFIDRFVAPQTVA